MILSDVDIVERVVEGDLEIGNVMDWYEQLQPSSFDLRMGDVCRYYKSEWRGVHGDMDKRVNPRQMDHEDVTHEISIADKLTVEPDDFYLVPVREWMSLPSDIQGEIKGRSSYGRTGLEVHSTAGLVDAGWSGQLVLEISNNSNATLEIEPGTRVGQIVFKRLQSDSWEGYGEKDNSKYQNQEGATASRAVEDSVDSAMDNPDFYEIAEMMEIV